MRDKSILITIEALTDVIDDQRKQILNEQDFNASKLNVINELRSQIGDLIEDNRAQDHHIEDQEHKEKILKQRLRDSEGQVIKLQTLAINQDKILAEYEKLMTKKQIKQIKKKLRNGGK